MNCAKITTNSDRTKDAHKNFYNSYKIGPNHLQLTKIIRSKQPAKQIKMENLIKGRSNPRIALIEDGIVLENCKCFNINVNVVVL